MLFINEEQCQQVTTAFKWRNLASKIYLSVRQTQGLDLAVQSDFYDGTTITFQPLRACGFYTTLNVIFTKKVCSNCAFFSSIFDHFEIVKHNWFYFASSPAHLAASLDSQYSLQILQQFGGNLELRNKKGTLPIHEAAKDSHIGKSYCIYILKK